MAVRDAHGLELDSANNQCKARAKSEFVKAGGKKDRDTSPTSPMGHRWAIDTDGAEPLSRLGPVLREGVLPDRRVKE